MLHVLLATAVASAAPLPASGEYGQLKLAFSDGRVTWEFSETRMGNGTEQAPQFSCAFALTGAWKRGATDSPVLTWWPGEDPPDQRIHGRLTIDGGSATLSLDEDPGGCDVTGDTFKATPFSEALRTRRAWLEVSEVRSSRAHFSATPGGAPHRAYVTRGDIVGVKTRAGTFVRVEYVDGRRPVEGWLPSADLEAPASRAK